MAYDYVDGEYNLILAVKTGAVNSKGEFTLSLDLAQFTQA